MFTSIGAQLRKSFHHFGTYPCVMPVIYAIAVGKPKLLLLLLLLLLYVCVCLCVFVCE